MSFALDDEGDWVAHLSCGHRQHVRHQPPFQMRPWVLDPVARASRVATPLECPLCDRTELPEELCPVPGTASGPAPRAGSSKPGGTI